MWRIRMREDLKMQDRSPSPRKLLRPLEAAFAFLVVLVLLFEEWGVQPLVRAFGWLARWRPIAMLEAALARLPPYGALAAFALPAALLVPFKLLAVYLLASHAPLSAALVFVAAKIVGTGLVGRIYMITQPQLMRIGWFARAYAVFMPWKDAAFAYVRSSWAWRWGRMVRTMARRRFDRLVLRWRGSGAAP
jgi:hypothetical protein